MKVLVTGGAGFIGSHIVERLVKEGYEVVVNDDLSTGNIEYVPKTVRFYQQSITDKRIMQIFEKEKPNAVIHQAAQVDVQRSIHDPYQDALTNIIGTLNLLHASVNTGVQKLIYASSSAVYGEPQNLPLKEDHQTKPISLYGNSKLLGEYCIHIFHRLYHIDYTILRYANVYGPRQGEKGEGGVVSIFIDKLLNQQPPYIYGDGEQTRDFVFVKDVVEANLCALEKGSCSVVNIGTEVETSVYTLFHLLRHKLGGKTACRFASARPGDIRQSCLSTESARRVLGWKSRYSLEQGIEETINWSLKRFA